MLPRLAFRIAGLCAATMLLASGAVHAHQMAPAEPSVYSGPQQIAVLPSGRGINYYCIGDGHPTVILTAGLRDITFNWRPVHAALAETTRVCAWDRAGHGFSAASPEPQDAAHTTADLEAWLAASGLDGPYVMVGHSMGAFEALLFTHLHRARVAGIVVVDGTHPDQEAEFMVAAPRAYADLIADDEAEDAAARACIDRIRTSGRRERCLGVPPESLTGRRAELADMLMDRWSDPDSVENQLSLLQLFPVSAGQAAAGLQDLGDLPMIVLTSSRVGLPPEFADEEESVNFAKLRLARRLADLSTRGVHRVVADSGHYIHHDQPDAVIAAVNEVVGLVRARSGP